MGTSLVISGTELHRLALPQFAVLPGYGSWTDVGSLPETPPGFPACAIRGILTNMSSSGG